MKRLLPITLGMLAAIGPFVTDFYLPMLPELGEWFKASPSEVSLSLTTSMIGLAAGQIFVGPLTDKYGRKLILILSMIVFIVSTALSLFSENIFFFNLMRLFQGLGGAGGIVLSKSMSTDMFRGEDLAKFMALLSVINSLAPICAPVVGGVMSTFTTWQGIFVLLLIIGIILTVLCLYLPETLPSENRNNDKIVRVYFGLLRAFANKTFTLSTLSSIFSFVTFFGYISSAPFILQSIYHLSPFQFSLCFGVNAFACGIGSFLSMRVGGLAQGLKIGAIGSFVAAIILSASLIYEAPIYLIMSSYILMLFFMGMVLPTVTTIAMDSLRDKAGVASAVFGSSGFVAGAVASPLVGIGNILVSSSFVFIIGSFLCMLFSLVLCERMGKAALKSISN